MAYCDESLQDQAPYVTADRSLCDCRIPERCDWCLPEPDALASAACRTCRRPIASPFRVYGDRGRVVAGCVSADHDGTHVTPSESARWHNRKEAKAIRRATKARGVLPLAEALRRYPAAFRTSEVA